MQRASKETASKMTNDILHGMFTNEYMAQHTVCGGNEKKTALPQQLVSELIGMILYISIGVLTVL